MLEPVTRPGFTFGENWARFTAELTDERVQAAVASVARLLERERLDGVTAIDVGSGSGLFSEALLALGVARLTSVDVDPECVRLTEARVAPYRAEHGRDATVVHGSILDPGLLDRVEPAELVYAWGSLHHTGAMWTAIGHAARLVRPGGILVLSLYNRHWTSGIWTAIKRIYRIAPAAAQRAMVWAYLASGNAYNTLTGRRIALERGMERRSDVRDWLGGYPYEHVTIAGMHDHARREGWAHVRTVPCQGMTGANEFVFRIGS